MSASLRKFVLNFTPRALGVLGPREYARLWVNFIRSLPTVLRNRQLTQLDERMGSRQLRVHYKGTSFSIDCSYCDARTRNTTDGSLTFALIRELFIRDCYLRGVSFDRDRIDYVVDCGANRGLFSVFAATFAHKVVSVEPVSMFHELIQHNMAINGARNFVIDQSLLGTAGGERGTTPALASETSIVTVADLMARHDLPHIDFLKIDIEGDEFGLFQNPLWLQSVTHIAMELHVCAGDPQLIVDALTRYDFCVELRDVQFNIVDDATCASFLYATSRVG